MNFEDGQVVRITEEWKEMTLDNASGYMFVQRHHLFLLEKPYRNPYSGKTYEFLIRLTLLNVGGRRETFNIPIEHEDRFELATDI